MHFSKFFSYTIFLFLFVISIFISTFSSNKIKSFAVSVVNCFSCNKETNISLDDQEELTNQFVEFNFIPSLSQYFFLSQGLYEQIQNLNKLLNHKIIKPNHDQIIIDNRINETKNLVDLYLNGINAKIIYREINSWNNVLWIDVGEETNKRLQKNIVIKNSPVVVGGNLLGVVEYVDTNKSRVRLITDAGFITAVRAARGNVKDKYICELLSSLEYMVEDYSDLNMRDKDCFLETIFDMKAKIKKSKNYQQYLAKGEVFGLSQPSYLSKLTLKGIGFNYYYSDEEGLARDILTGQTFERDLVNDKINILQKRDVLMSSGVDGICQLGLRVGIIDKVYNIQEGDCSYDIDAIPCISQINDVSYVFVLPATLS